MTYTFKLSRRLAILRSAAAAIFTLSCTLDVSGPLPIVMTPETVSLPPGGNQQFTLTGGSLDGPMVAWSASGGTISSTGLYTAGEALGAYQVTATAPVGDPHTAAVTIIPVPIVMTPASVSLPPGGNQQFTLTGGSPGGPTVTWSASGGTISSTGLYTAGDTVGAYQVIATEPVGQAHTAAVTITPPPVEVFPGQSIQAAVDANPIGTTFILKAGTHQNQMVFPKDSDQFIGEVGAVMDGGLVTKWAFLPASGKTTITNNVRIQGIKITRYTPDFQYGAIYAGSGTPGVTTTGWVVQNCEISANTNGGAIRLGNKMKVLNNNIHHNGEIGIVGGLGDSILVEGNEIAFNNTQRYSPGNEAGGTKFVRTTNLIVRNNYSHDNWGPGLWTDGDNINVLYEGNRVEDNATSGIFHEVSQAAVIRNNIVKRNGFQDANWLYGAGIQISASRDVEVYGNTVEENARGIVGIMQNRGSGAYGLLSLENLYVHDNIVTMTVVATTATGHANVTGIGQDIGDNRYYTSKGNRFVHNTYHLGTAAKYFEWMNNRRTEAEWKAYGQDVSGTFTR